MLLQLQALLLDALLQIKNQQQTVLSDLYISLSSDELNLTLYDDVENQIYQTTAECFAQFKQDGLDFEQEVIRVFKEVFTMEELQEALKSLQILYPFSVVLVDNHLQEVAELTHLDDSVVILDDQFMQKLDKELDDFLEQLLKE